MNRFVTENNWVICVCLPSICVKLPWIFNKWSVAVRDSERVVMALGLEMLRASTTVRRVIRGLLVSVDLPHAYLDSNIVFIPEIRSISSLIKVKLGESLFVIYCTH